MIAASKEKINRDNARSQSAKSEKDTHRVCPSKLTKQELEDLYFVLMDTNIDLKRTVNTQQDNIKLLNTKLHRLMTAQKNCIKEGQCCPQTKAVVNEQRDIIADLKKANDRMSDRIRILNMRLCSARQFLKRSPSLANSRCVKCCIAPPASLKNSTVSMLQNNNKKGESERNPSVAAEGSSRDAEKDPVSTRTVETETDEQEKEAHNTVCKENRCRTLMEELKQKIIDLQEESSKFNSDYSSRISRLESEMSALQAENIRVKQERAASQHNLELMAQKEKQLAAKLRAADAQCSEISSRLLMEKNKVAELETRVRAAEMSGQVARALEKRQSITIVMPEKQTKSEATQEMEITQSTSVATQDTHPKSDDVMLADIEKQASAYVVHIQAKQAKDIEIVTEEIEHRPCTSCAIQNQSPPAESGNIANGNEEQQSTREPMEEIKQPCSVPPSIECSGTLKGQENALDIDMAPRTTPRKSCPHCVTNSPSYVVLSHVATPSPDKSKRSDDSGYNDNQPSKEEMALAKVNAELVKNITDLQQKLDLLRIASAGLKTEQSSKSTDTKMADTDNKMDDVSHERVVEKDSKTSRSSRESGRPEYDSVKSLQREGKKDTSERAKDAESIEASAILRANQLWAQYSGEQLQQRGDRIQFSNYNRQCDSEDKIVTAHRSPSEDRDSFSRSVKRRRNDPKQLWDERHLSITDKNEIVDKIEMIANKYREDNMRGYEFKPDYRQGRDSFRLDSTAPKDESKLDNTQTDKVGIKIQDNDSFGQDVDKPKDDFKQKFNADLKTGVQIKEVVPGLDKKSQETLRIRDSNIDQTIRYKINEIKEQDVNNQQTTRNISEGETASESLRSTSDAAPAHATRVVLVASPDNTDHEISHLSDLPPEHDVSDKNLRGLMSPGEQKFSTTFTDTYTEPSQDPPTMSEGEVYVNSAGRRSIGETRDEAVEAKSYREAASVSQKMEQALQSIGEELARCRELLQNTRPEIAPETRETSTTCPSRVALKHSSATPQLVHPSIARDKCTFTLHIGTLVLSDEAVVYSRDKSLLLTWKFYDQNVAMTRMRSGRVILFDFTTEYDAYMDERFTEYLKYETMPIVICELNKQNCPFACAELPFRDVMLNPNHRVDMSLTLTVGPDMRREDATLSVESLVISDEVGVLDLWCMLRKRSSQSELRRSNPLSCDYGQVMMDNRSDEYRMSVEQYSHTPNMPPLSQQPQSVQGTIFTPPVSSPLQLLDDSSLAKYSVHPDRLSSVIPHEVPTNIRSSAEMKRALEYKRTAQSNEFKTIKRLEKLEDNVLSHQPHQSISSWARFLKRQSRCTKKPRNNSLPSEVYDTLRSTFKPTTKINVPAAQSETEEPETDQSEDKESQLKKAVTINPRLSQLGWEQPQLKTDKSQEVPKESIVITILWLALNEECGAMTDSSVQRLYVAFSLLGRSGADFETPVSLPKPRSYVEKCVFNFRKSIQLRQCDLPQLGHMGRCRSNGMRRHNHKDCVVFTVISEPAEDPLGLASCEDIGHAYLYLGDVLSISVSDTYVEVVPVHSAHRWDVVCGVLCVQVDGLELVRKSTLVNLSQ